jgi:hypothetical protein
MNEGRTYVCTWRRTPHGFEADFVSLLTPSERRRFTWREVQRVRGIKHYLEIVASRTTIPLATIKEQYVGHDLYRCPTCGYKNDPTYLGSGFDGI